MVPQYPYGLSSLYLLPFSNLNTHTHAHTHAHRPIPAMPHQPYPQPIECAWQLQHFTMQHTSPPHTTTYPPHAAIHTRRLYYIHVPLTPHSTPQSTPTMTTTLFHLQQHPFTSPTVSTEHISKNITLLYQSTLKKPNHLHHNLTSCRPM